MMSGEGDSPMAKPAKKKQAKRRVALVPRQGPPTNLRPAGVHDDKRRKTRSEAEKAALEDEAAFELSIPYAWRRRAYGDVTGEHDSRGRGKWFVMARRYAVPL
jgi:hypothetical protein